MIPIGITGFIDVEYHDEVGATHTVFIANSISVGSYEPSEWVKLSGLCKYCFLLQAGVVCGVLFSSPSSHTLLKPAMLKIGACVPPFTVNQNFKKAGVLVYESADSGRLIIPVDVKSPLLIEVDSAAS